MVADDMKVQPSAKRPRLEAPPAEEISRDRYLEAMREVLSPMTQIAAMYNSLVGGVIKDPELMALPIHDHAIVRGHAVFDTCSVINGRLFRADVHLDRHIASARAARIPLPYGDSDEACKVEMRRIIAQTVVASGCRNASVRYYTSVGPGGFGITPAGCRPAFYVVVMDKRGEPIKPEDMTGIREYTVKVPLKPGLLARTKSNNYLLNALTAMEAEDRGGKFGILIDEDGCIAEACLLNCSFITKDRRLITPTFDKILAGTTVRNVLRVGQRLVEQGVLTAVSQQKIPEALARDCVEMFLSGGDLHMVPVTHWDDVPVGTGRVGEVTQLILKLLQEDSLEGETDLYELVYAS